MSWRGDVRLGATLDVKFTTLSGGVPTTLIGSPVVSAYVGNGTTEITAGITLTVDFDGRTGLHNVRVVASSGNGFATATDVDLVLTAGTVGGVSVVGYIVASFSIENRSALMPTTAGRTLAVAAGGEADANTTKVAGTTQTARDLGAQLDATVSSRLATAGYTAPDNATITAINAKTAALPTDPADQSAVEAAIAANVAGLSTFNPATMKVTPVDVDGLTYASAMEFLLAVLGGVAVPSGSTVAFKRRDGTTTKVTVTYGSADGERTGSVIT